MGEDVSLGSEFPRFHNKASEHFVRCLLCLKHSSNLPAYIIPFNSSPNFYDMGQLDTENVKKYADYTGISGRSGLKPSDLVSEVTLDPDPLLSKRIVSR